jgi:RND superfamily putative drug exporter
MEDRSRQRYGPLGRLGAFAADHRKGIALAWAVGAVALGFFAVHVETALSGAGWEATGSQSVKARELIEKRIGGPSSYSLAVVVTSPTVAYPSPPFKGVVANVERVLAANGAVRAVVGPCCGAPVAPGGHTVLVEGVAALGPNGMVKAAGDLQPKLLALQRDGIRVEPTGQAAVWADFNEANRKAMLRSEFYSWPVTLGILLLAFGSLAAAGLPLLLTLVGLLSAAGLLYLGTKLTPISIWAMNFALMFALALGIDYALFIVSRFRGAHLGSGLPIRQAVAETMDTAGKAVLFSGLTVLVSLSAVLLVESPAFRSMAVGIMLAVVFVLSATLTRLPAVLSKLGAGVDRFSLRLLRADVHRSKRFGRWAHRLADKPFAHGLPALLILLALAAPVIGLKTAMPAVGVLPANSPAREGYLAMERAFGQGAAGPLQVVVKAGAAPAATSAAAAAGVGLRQVAAGGGYLLFEGQPNGEPRAAFLALRHRLAGKGLVGGPVAEAVELQEALSAHTALVIGVVMALGFLLLLLALQALPLAALGVATNLLASGAAFGVARLIFQEGNLHSLLGFQPQGFVDAWAPVFFFAMVFAISMDYTVFLLSSAKEHWERSGNAREALVGGLAHSGRVIFAAAAVMVGVFFTFALSGPLAPKEMGVILGVAVLLDAALVRLLLLPVALRLLEARAWYLPRWASAVLPRISFAHGHHPQPALATEGAGS